MPWKRTANELVVIEPVHYDHDAIRGLISDLLRSHAKAGSVTTLLKKLLETGHASEELIFQFSKWCDWPHQDSKVIARSIASILFYGNICRRLRDQQDGKIPDPRTADADYRTWMDQVVLASQGLPEDTVFPGDVDEHQTFTEGAAVQRLVNGYERDREARRKCIQRHGTRCCICSFDFGRAYDGIGTGHIHVHHLRPLSQTGESHKVNPITDLRPVCPNCHLVIHLYRQPYTIDDVKAMVARARELHPEGPFK